MFITQIFVQVQGKQYKFSLLFYIIGRVIDI